MEYEIIIVADEHDCHFLTAINSISREDLEKLKPLFAVIKTNKELHNWNTTGYGPDVYETYPIFIDEIDLLDGFTPPSEDGLKRLVSIYYYPLSHKTVAL